MPLVQTLCAPLLDRGYSTGRSTASAGAARALARRTRAAPTAPPHGLSGPPSTPSHSPPAASAQRSAEPQSCSTASAGAARALARRTHAHRPAARPRLSGSPSKHARPTHHPPTRSERSVLRCSAGVGLDRRCRGGGECLSGLARCRGTVPLAVLRRRSSSAGPCFWAH